MTASNVISSEFSSVSLAQDAMFNAIVDAHRNLQKLAPHLTVNEISEAIYPQTRAQLGLFAKYEAAERASLMDPKGTGAFNEAYFMAALKAGMADMERSRRKEEAPTSKKAIMFYDVIDMKGHNKKSQYAGDLAIQAFVDKALETIRGGEFLARVGGDEFITVVSDYADLGEVVSRLNEAFQCLSYTYEGDEIPVQIYVAGHEIDLDHTPEQNYDAAGKNLAAAKVAAGVGQDAAVLYDKPEPAP